MKGLAGCREEDDAVSQTRRLLIPESHTCVGIKLFDDPFEWIAEIFKEHSDPLANFKRKFL